MSNFFVCIFVIVQALLCWSLRITNVAVPSPMTTGNNGVLECQWDTTSESIYSLKWYLGKDEFYRWTPAQVPQIQVFLKNVNLKVDLENSKEGRVIVSNVSLEAGEHILRCEISEEGPAFHTEFKEVMLTIVDLPDTRPNITLGKTYHIPPNDVITLNCTSPRAKPAANITFSINEERAEEEWVIRYPVYIDAQTGLETAVHGLRFPILPRFRMRGYVAVRCVAEVLKIYWESSELVVAGEMPQKASIMEGRASGGILSWSDSAFLTRMTFLILQWALVV